jgi:hypothetical protein
MPLKGYKLSEEHRKKLSLSHKGQIPWCAGKKLSIEHKENLSKSHKGLKQSTETIQKRSDLMKGRTTCPKTLFRKGHNVDMELRRRMSENHKGIKAWNWKGGITPINAKIRNSIEFRLWREAVFARDNWTCQRYGIKGGKLHPHHIKNFADYPELRFAIDNGITFSEKAHREFHKKYGIKNNTKEQLKEFLKL